MELGAEGAVDYTKPGWPQEVIRLSDGRGVDIAIDSVGGQILAETLETMAISGRLVNCGYTAGTQWGLDLASFLRRKLSFMSSFMGSNGYLNEVMKFVETGQLKPVIHQVFPFERVKEAHLTMINRERLREDCADLVGVAQRGSETRSRASQNLEHRSLQGYSIMPHLQ